MEEHSCAPRTCTTIRLQSATFHPSIASSSKTQNRSDRLAPGHWRACIDTDSAAIASKLYHATGVRVETYRSRTASAKPFKTRAGVSP